MQTQTINPTQLVHAVKQNAMTWLILFIISVFVIEYVENLHYQSLVGEDGELVHWDWVLLIPTAIVWLLSEHFHKREWAWIAGILFCGVGPTLFAGSLIRNHQLTDGNTIMALLLVSGLLFGVYIKVKVENFFTELSEKAK